MPYIVDVPDSVRSYLENPPLPDTVKEAAKEAAARVLEYLADVSDAYRLDPANRVGPDHPCFNYGLIFGDHPPNGTGFYYGIRLVVDDSGACYGVLLVRYAEYTTGNPIP